MRGRVSFIHTQVWFALGASANMEKDRDKCEAIAREMPKVAHCRKQRTFQFLTHPPHLLTEVTIVNAFHMGRVQETPSILLRLAS